MVNAQSSAAPQRLKSCAGCKFLYGDGSGYSSWTWIETFARCALDLNPALREDHDIPDDWNPSDPVNDRWHPTMNGRCARYALGVFIRLDQDREDNPADHSDDAEQIAAILAHDGRQ